MNPRIRYRGMSGIDVGVDAAQIGLATHADAQQGYLGATLLRVDVVRDALRAVHAVAWPTPPDPQTVPTPTRDLWFSVFEDAVFVEAPAPDGRSWLRVRLARALFSRSHDVAVGTTTLRLPWSLGRELRRLSVSRTTSFATSPGGADAAIDGSIVEERSALSTSEAWQSALLVSGGSRGSSCTTRVPPSSLVRPLADVVDVVDGSAVADDAPLVIPADPPWRAHPVVVPRGARLRGLAPLLAHARCVSFSPAGDVVFVDGEHIAATLAVLSEVHDGGGAGDDVRAGRAFIDVDGVMRPRPLAIAAGG
jgi:hypothetical protein